MKFLLPIASLGVIFNSTSQLSSGFSSSEAKDMIALCNSFTYLELYDTDQEIIPTGYKKEYTSPTIGLDNMFQVYINGKIGVINFRGSTDKKSSWLENIYSAMIPIEGKIIIQDKEIPYIYGKDTASNVHSGYTLSMCYLESEVLEQLKALNDKGIKDIILTGHSQGGSLAIMTRCMIAYNEKAKSIRSKSTIKVYTFAQPMCGNRAFVEEYNKAFCDKGMSYSLINPDDKVPHMPMSYNDTTFLRDNLVAMFTSKDEFDSSKMLKDGLMLLFQDKLKNTVSKFGESVTKQIEKELGNIDLPEPTGGINYAQVGNVIHLPPPYYPLELKDSTILTDTLFLANNPRDKNGIFENKSVYKKTSMSLNHKPYNYYTAVLRKFFPKNYDAIEPKSFGL